MKQFDPDEYPTSPAAETEPAASENNDSIEQPHKAKKAAPKRRRVLKAGIYGSAIITVVSLAYVGVSVYLKDSASYVRQDSMTAEQFADYEVNPEKPAAPNPSEPSTSAIDHVAIHDAAAPLPASLDSDLAAQIETIIEIQSLLEKAQETDAKLTEQVESLLGMRANVLSLINMQSVIAESIEDRLFAIEDKLQDMSSMMQRPETTAEPDQSAPPFRLIAIDRWDNVWNAVIFLDSKMAMLEPNDSRAGWTLLEVDASRKQARFVHADGVEAVLDVGG